MEQQNKNFSTEISLKKRLELLVSGVYEIISSDENSIHVNTSDGAILIEGENLRIINMSAATGTLSAEGLICSISYNDKIPLKKIGFFARMFQ
jgi:sporulation protein YabP